MECPDATEPSEHGVKLAGIASTYAVVPNTLDRVSSTSQPLIGVSCRRQCNWLSAQPPALPARTFAP